MSVTNVAGAAMSPVLNDDIVTAGRAQARNEG